MGMDVQLDTDIAVKGYIFQFDETVNRVTKAFWK